jgi:hypothetical protein
MTARSFPSITDPVALVASAALIVLGAVILASDAAPRLTRMPGATPDSLPSNAVVLRSFALVALKREHEADADPGIAKWQRPIRVRVIDRAATDARTHAALWAHLRRLARLSGLSIRRAGPGETANYRVIFTARRDFADRVRASLAPERQAVAVRLIQANCVGMFKQDLETQAITAATVIIPVDHARARGLLHRCIVEETTQVLGLPNDAALPVASVFNDASHDRDMSAHDALLLRLLYHPSLRPGMKRRAAMAAARAALPDVRRRFLADTARWRAQVPN